MNNAEKSADQEEIVKRARMRALRRARRLDVLVASMLLLSLIFGWAVRFAAPEQRPGAGVLATGGPRQP
jgi:hypothetical protein